MTEQPGLGNGVPEFHLGDRLSKALDVASISVQEMAEYLDVSRNTVSNYLHMRTPVNGGTLRLWALRTGVRLEWLQTGKAPSEGDPDGGGVVVADDANELIARQRAELGRTRSTRQYALAVA